MSIASYVLLSSGRDFVDRHASGDPCCPGHARVFALPEMRWAAVALVLFLFGLAVQLFGVQQLGGPVWALYLAGYVAGGWEPGLAGLRALREKTLDADPLMVVAATGAAAVAQVMDGGLLLRMNSQVMDGGMLRVREAAVAH